MAATKMEVFGEIDRDVKSRVASEYPAWYFETHLANMKEERESLIRRIERGEVPHDSVPQTTAEARAMKERIDQIESSRPELSDAELDELRVLRNELSQKISDAMFSRSEMMMGTASAHEEARRMIQPVISISPKVKGLASTCNVRMVGSKISRNDATKIWKIIGKLIGEGTNVEGLRKDRATVLTRATAGIPGV